MSRKAAGATAYARAGLDPSPVALAARKQDGELVLDLMDVIGADLFGEGITASAVSRELGRAMPTDTVRVRVNSPGGSPFEGNAIRSTLAEHKGKVIVEVHGLAASAAVAILAAGDEVLIAFDAMVMIHDAWGFAIGPADDLREYADHLDRISAVMARTYAEHTGKDEGDVRDLMRAETWMSADEAIEFGFASALMPSDDAQASAAATERVFAALTKFQRTPDGLLDRYRSQRGELLVAAMAAPTGKATPENDMKHEVLCALLGLNASASVAEVEAAIKDGAQARQLLKEEREAKAKAEDRVAELEGKDAVRSIEMRLVACYTTGPDGKGPTLSHPSKSQTAKEEIDTILARAAMGGVALEIARQDLERIEKRKPIVASPSQGRARAEGDAPSGVPGLTKAELDYCAAYGKDPQEVAAHKAKAKAKLAANSGLTEDTED